MRTIRVSSSRGESTIESDLSPRQAYEVLAAKPNKTSFENSLLEAARTYGDRLNAGKSQWLIFKAQEHLDRGTRPEPVRTSIGDLTPILALFARAKGSLKYPKIRLQVGDRPVVLAIAGDNSRYRGQINVTTGEPFGTPNSFYGRIDQDGSTAIRQEAVLELLRRFAADPAGVAAQYGRSTDTCCFCGLPLTNGEMGSAEVGYGPTCAKKWQLPWEPNGKAWEFTQGQLIKPLCERDRSEDQWDEDEEEPQELSLDSFLERAGAGVPF